MRTIDRVMRIAELAHDKYPTDPMRFYRVMARVWRSKQHKGESIGPPMAQAATEATYGVKMESMLNVAVRAMAKSGELWQ